MRDTTAEYDNLGRRTKVTDELGQWTKFAFDAASNLTKMTDRRGQVREFVFDNLNRQTQELWKSGTTTVRTVAYTFDAADDPFDRLDRGLPAARPFRDHAHNGRAGGHAQHRGGHAELQPPAAAV